MACIAELAPECRVRNDCPECLHMLRMVGDVHSRVVAAECQQYCQQIHCSEAHSLMCPEVVCRYSSRPRYEKCRDVISKVTLTCTPPTYGEPHHFVDGFPMSALIKSAAFSAIAMTGAAYMEVWSALVVPELVDTNTRLTVCPETIVGKTDASAILNPSIPCTLSIGSTTPPSSSGAIRALHAGWYSVSPVVRMIFSISASVRCARLWCSSGWVSPSGSMIVESGAVWAMRSSRRIPRMRILTSLGAAR